MKARRVLYGLAVLVGCVVFGWAVYAISQMPPSETKMIGLAQNNNYAPLLEIYVDTSQPKPTRGFAILQYMGQGNRRQEIFQQLEGVLVGYRDSAENDSEQSIHKRSLGYLNYKVAHKTRKQLLNKVMNVVGKKNRKNQIIVKFDKNYLSKSPDSVSVDIRIIAQIKEGSIYDSGETQLPQLPGVGFKPDFKGLSSKEMASALAEIKTVGFILYDNFSVGNYTGGCYGTAYRNKASLFTVDLENKQITAVHSLMGEPPPDKVTRKQSYGKKCDAYGKGPSYSEYFNTPSTP